MAHLTLSQDLRAKNKILFKITQETKPKKKIEKKLREIFVAHNTESAFLQSRRKAPRDGNRKDHRINRKVDKGSWGGSQIPKYKWTEIQASIIRGMKN